MYEGDLWLRCATNANTMARRLAEGAAAKGVEMPYGAQANEVFALLPEDRVGELAARFHFYTWQDKFAPGQALVRWVTSWDTTADDVDALVGAI